MHRGHFNVTSLVNRDKENVLAVLVHIPDTPLANQGRDVYKRQMLQMVRTERVSLRGLSLEFSLLEMISAKAVLKLSLIHI